MIDRRTIHKQDYLDCVALVVDINGSEKLIGAGADGLTAQFFRDLLSGGIEAVEKCNGSVISFTGDGFQAVLPTEKDAAHACWHIAKDLRRTREYLSDTCDDGTPAWPQMEIGVGLKIGIERGVLRSAQSPRHFLGSNPFSWVSPPCMPHACWHLVRETAASSARRPPPTGNTAGWMDPTRVRGSTRA